jgi:hypothetical protein
LCQTDQDNRSTAAGSIHRDRPRYPKTHALHDNIELSPLKFLRGSDGNGTEGSRERLAAWIRLDDGQIADASSLRRQQCEDPNRTSPNDEKFLWQTIGRGNAHIMKGVRQGLNKAAQRLWHTDGNRQDIACSCGDELGESTMPMNPNESALVAALRKAGPAGPTCPTGFQWIDDDRSADEVRIVGGGSLYHRARDLMTHDLSGETVTEGSLVTREV